MTMHQPNTCFGFLCRVTRPMGTAAIIIALLTQTSSAQLSTLETDDFPVSAPIGGFEQSRTSPAVYILTSAAILTAISLRYDQPIADEIISWKDGNSTVRAISPVVTEMGTGGFAIGLLGSFTAYGFVAKDDRALEVGKLGAVSFLATGLAVQLVKHLSGRERPEVSTQTGGFWSGPFASLRNRSDKTRGIGSYDAFASGHTTTAFSLATVFADVYEDKPWVAYVSYSMASVVAVSRITERTHWLSDCIVGAMIGIYGTKFVENLMYSTPGISINPLLYMDGDYGLCLSVAL